MSSYYVEKPIGSVELETLQAWQSTESYIGKDQVWRVLNTASQCKDYRQFSFAMAIGGISGWPVVAIWNDMRETFRDACS